MKRRRACRRPMVESVPPHDFPARGCCQWIEGDPRNGGTFCGQPAALGSAWCAGHHARCYLPVGSSEARQEVARMNLIAGNRKVGRACAHFIPAF